MSIAQNGPICLSAISTNYIFSDHTYEVIHTCHLIHTYDNTPQPQVAEGERDWAPALAQLGMGMQQQHNWHKGTTVSIANCPCASCILSLQVNYDKIGSLKGDVSDDVIVMQPPPPPLIAFLTYLQLAHFTERETTLTEHQIATTVPCDCK